jgi:hypothetical protein
MALIRGATANFPCPICLVPKTQRSDGSSHKLRTSEDMQKVFNDAAAMHSKTDKNTHLKSYGLRGVKVRKTSKIAFSKLSYSFFRMCFGAFGIVIHTRHYHLTGYIQITLAYSKTIYGVR